jgi:putative oxidoreductase
MTAGTSYIAASGRILIAVIFLFAGIGKIVAPTMTQNYIASAGLPFPLVAYLVAIAVEVGGGTLLALGVQTRLVAIVMAIFSVATSVGFHHDFVDQNQLMHFLKNIAITGGLLQVVAFGAGTLSIEGRRGLAKSPTATSSASVGRGHTMDSKS